MAILTISIVGENSFLTVRIQEKYIENSEGSFLYSRKIASNSIVETLVNEIVILLEESKITYFQIKEIIVTVAPVSFTGVRAILATCYAIEFCTNAKISGVTLNQILLSALKTEIYDNRYSLIKTIIQDKHGYYIQDFNFNINNLKPINDIVRIKDLEEVIVINNELSNILIISNVEINIGNIPNIQNDIDEKSILYYKDFIESSKIEDNFLEPLPIYVY